MAELAGTVHFLGEDLLPPCPSPWAKYDEEGATRLTPVLTEITCQGCIEFLSHV